jgi:hypothetical protein
MCRSYPDCAREVTAADAACVKSALKKKAFEGASKVDR